MQKKKEAVFTCFFFRLTLFFIIYITHTLIRIYYLLEEDPEDVPLEPLLLEDELLVFEFTVLLELLRLLLAELRVCISLVFFTLALRLLNDCPGFDLA